MGPKTGLECNEDDLSKLYKTLQNDPVLRLMSYIRRPGLT